jgi:hypothetical protein
MTSRKLVGALALAGLLALSSVAQGVVVRTAVAVRPVAPVARAVAVGAAATATAVAIGSVVRTLPPSCSSVMVGNVAYQQCGSTWYQPQYAGSSVSYTVVNPPR